MDINIEDTYEDSQCKIVLWYEELSESILFVHRY